MKRVHKSAENLLLYGPHPAKDPDKYGWHYSDEPEPDKDCRKLVTLEDERGMVWIGIRAWHHQDHYWMNGGEPEPAKVIAWMNLPEPAEHRYVRGVLT